MTIFKALSFVASLLLVSPPVSAFAQGAAATNDGAVKPDVADLLFGGSQWSAAPAGSTITYTYAKKSSDVALGASFDDTITLKLDKSDSADRRTVEVKMFSGTNTKPAGPFDAVAQNPVLLLVLEENVQELAKLFKGNPRYLKNAIRKAWREKAVITPTKVMVGGKTYPGTRIAIQPFLGDAEKDKMMGLDTMSYIIDVADAVPGAIATIDITGPTAAAPRFSEVLHYQAEVKP